VLGGIATTTNRVAVGTGVTCPIVRIHPAVVAHAAATTSRLFGDRFFLGVGTGEALNEHILGHRWPSAPVRLQMLEEAITIIRALLTGDTVDHRGSFYEVENAKLFDPPEAPLPIIVSGFGAQAAELAGRVGDGFWGTSPERELLETFERAGGTGPRYAQLTFCWARDERDARRMVHEVWPNTAVPGQLSQDRPTWTHFEHASGLVSEDDATKSTPCGPEILRELLESVGTYVDVGYDHLYFRQIGPDQEGFFGFWESELRPALERRRVAA
jgi:G6PDH family F420-dependent oxidoreductase